MTDRLRQNLAAVHNRMTSACRRAGRNSGDVRLVAVTKSVPIEVIPTLHSLGETAFGENRPQQLIERAQSLPGDVEWHLIGQLQRNKVRAVLPWTRWIHSVASPQLLERIGGIAGELGLCPTVLLQANVSGETAKQGFSPDELLVEWPALRRVPHVRIAGLMTMAPDTSNTEIVRATFRGLRELRDELSDSEFPLRHLSMGMSQDFEIAIEEGATLIRLGSILFEGIV